MGVIQIVVNPAAGQGNAPAFVEDHVLPVLQTAFQPFTLHKTEGEADGIRLGAELFHSLGTAEESVLVIGGGDGTAHEVIEGILKAARAADRNDIGEWDLVILPLGTANALFHSLFPPHQKESTRQASQECLDRIAPDTDVSEEILDQLPSLLQYLYGISTPHSLPISLTSFISSTGSSLEPIPSHIVLSTALHAGILKSSEALRAEYPGVERFKKAAEDNVGIFHPATVKLLPGPDGAIHQYSPARQAFVPPFTVDGADYTLNGPFAYLLSSNTAPRLESTFVIVPTLARTPPTGQTMDVVILRPYRDPRVRKAVGEGGEAKGPEAWRPRIWEALMKAYEEGKHVDLVYQGEGPLLPATGIMGGQEDVCVEVFRCGGFEWTPVESSHEASHVVCADGSLHTIPAGGKARVTLMEPTSPGQGFFAWA